MKKSSVLMKDVAKKAGVHQTTVSLALRNHPSLPESTCKRIQKVAQEMGYRTDPTLSALSAYRRLTKEQPADQYIAWIINVKDPERVTGHHVYRQLFEGATERAAEFGFKLEMFWFGTEYKDSEALNEVLKNRNIRGLIIAAFEADNQNIELEWEQFSVVKISHVPRHLAFEAIISNQIEAVGLAISELQRIGVKRIGIATSEFEEINNHFTFAAGYHVHHRQIPPEDYVPPFYFEHNANHQGDFLQSIVKWGREHRIEAIISNWNSIEKVAQALTSEGQDCRFVSLDANERTQSLGGVKQDHHETGRRAVEMAVDQITTMRRGFVSNPCMTLITPKLIPIADAC